MLDLAPPTTFDHSTPLVNRSFVMVQPAGRAVLAFTCGPPSGLAFFCSSFAQLAVQLAVLQSGVQRALLPAVPRSVQSACSAASPTNSGFSVCVRSFPHQPSW